jgi:ectoine hydroxylase-related dioxygenase (phytanoyl-CoA dioxygenase family)
MKDTAYWAPRGDGLEPVGCRAGARGPRVRRLRSGTEQRSPIAELNIVGHRFHSRFAMGSFAKFAFYLDPVDHDTGAVRVLPASHHHPELYAGPLQPYLGYDGAIEERTGLRGENLPSWTLPSVPGDVVVWDFHVMHSSYGSTDARRQFALNVRSAPFRSTGSR